MNKKEKNLSVGIIGDGMSALSTLENLVKKLKKNNLQNTCTISIYTPSGNIGPGTPYKIDQPNELILNHENNNMGGINILLRDPQITDFYHWMQESNQKDMIEKHYPEYDTTNPIGYVPRSLYGRYLSQRFEQIKDFANEYGITINIVESEITSGFVKDKRTHLIDNDGNQHQHDFTVLATGHWKGNQPFKNNANAFNAHPVNEYLEKIDPDKTVMVSGTGLTGAEVILNLAKQGVKNIIWAGRSGQLRGIRGKYAPYQRKHLTLKNLQERASMRGEPNISLHDVVELMKEEMEHAYGKKIDWEEALYPKDMHKWLKKSIQQVEEGKELKWRSIFSSLGEMQSSDKIDTAAKEQTNGIRQEIYERLSAEDKKLFVEQYGTLFLAYQAPMPLRTAKKLDELMDQGIVKLIRNSQTIEETETGFKLQYSRTPELSDPTQPLADEHIGTAEADYYIRATGQEKNIQLADLYRSLIDAKVMVANPAGGITMNPRTHKILSPEGEEHPALYVIGIATMGDRLIPSNSFNTKYAAEISDDIITQIMQEIDRTTVQVGPNAIAH